MSFVLDTLPSKDHLLQVYEENDNSGQVSEPEDKIKVISNAPWYDCDDAEVSIDLSSKSQLKKLRRSQDLEIEGNSEESILTNGIVYQERLRYQYSKLHPTPPWAMKPQEANETEDELDFVHAFLSKKKEKYVNSKKIQVKNSYDISSIKYFGNVTNCLKQSTPVSGRSILAGGDNDKTLRIFSVPESLYSGSISGSIEAQPLLVGKEIYFEAFPIQCIKWMPNSLSAFVSGMKRQFYIVDIETQKASLYSSFGRHSNMFNKKTDSSAIGNVVSISDKFIAVGEGCGYVAILDTKSLSLVTRLKAGNDSRISAIEWDPSSSFPNLWTLEGDKVGSVVSQWDLRSVVSEDLLCSNHGNCVNRFSLSSAGLRGSSLSISPSGRNIAVGTDSGTTALIGSTENNILSCHSSPNLSIVKTIESLRTTIETISWSNDGNDLLAFASSYEKGAARIASITPGAAGKVSVKTLQGWPSVSMMPALGAVSSLEWSPSLDASLLAIANKKGKIHLFGMDN